MQRILAGTETEYGLLVAGHGAEEQIDDAMAVVRSFPGHRCFVGWDYRHEFPRADLRGFSAERLTIDPEDAKFDTGRTRPHDMEVRSDRVLENGARFYNDHGHPEYSTPESWGLAELAAHDHYGDEVALLAARNFTESTGLEAKVYKNNTDFHGSSYGSHESYLVPRDLGFVKLFAAVTPILIARTVLCGAGKVGSEKGQGPACPFQISQRADFFTESASVDTLYRRPIFNTRDEPHADPERWIRLHVISGDANIIPRCTSRKVGLVKLALMLANIGEAPIWNLANTVEAFKNVSRDETYKFEIKTGDQGSTTAFEIIESYCASAEKHLDLDEEMAGLLREVRALRDLLPADFPEFARHVDWAAKRTLLEQVIDLEGLSWRDTVALQSYDLEYHNIDPEQGLSFVLDIDRSTGAELSTPTSRARARGHAVKHFKADLQWVGWRCLRFLDGTELELDPTREFGTEIDEIRDIPSFIRAVRA